VDARWMREHGPALAAAAAIAGLVVWAFVSRLGFLSSSPYPLGVDGYYYPVQLRSLLDDGQLYYPSAPLGLWLMAPFAAVTNPITGAKIATALAGALIAVPAYVLGRRVSGDRAAGVLAAVLATTSTSGFYLTSEFAKNCIGLTMMLGYLCVLGWTLEKPSRRRGVAAVAAFAAVVMTHKVATGLAVIGSLPPLWVHGRARLGSRTMRRLWLGGAAAALVLLTLALLAPERFLGGEDAGKLGGLFGARASWDLAVLDSGGGSPLLFGREVLIGLAASLGAVVSLVLIARGEIESAAPAPDRALAVGLVVFGVLIAIPWIDISDANGLGFRLRLLAFVPLSIGAALLAGAATAWLAPLTRAALLVGIAAGWLFTRPMTATEEGVVRVHPAMVSAVSAMRGAVPKHHVVAVSERQVMFMVAWYTGTRARLSVSTVPANERWRLITFFYSGPALKRALRRVATEAPPEIARPLALHPFSPEGLVLVPEATWRWVLGRLSKKERARYEAWD
jgi:hypothetical protein